jgi:hypothetical protein
MFKAIWRWIKGVRYLWTGKIDKARENLDMNPHVMNATYDEILEQKNERIHHYKDAIAAMVHSNENKKQILKNLTEDVQRLEKLKKGAAAKAKKVAKQHNGEKAACMADPEYVKCQAAYSDFTSTLAEKLERISGLETDIEEKLKNIEGHKIQIKTLIRDRKKIMEEKHEAVADVQGAQHEKEIADMLTGIANDTTSKDLQRMRDMRGRALANAKVSGELAGLDTDRDEAEFLEEIASSEANNEFESLMDFNEEVVKEEPVAAEEEQLPE